MRPEIVITHGEELQQQLAAASRDLAARIVGPRLPLGWRIHRALVRLLRAIRRRWRRALS